MSDPLRLLRWQRDEVTKERDALRAQLATAAEEMKRLADAEKVMEVIRAEARVCTP